ncbi:MAG: beta-propeller domain-containing protein, partial [Candidatus Thermoplasmatota archaeon]|nr:beta-propeller domain-containing protein [Candidatus Thermoplasmatota archaeon]
MRRSFAVAVLAMFFLSGCLGAIDNVSDDDFDLIELPDGWGDLTQRSIGSPHLTGYATCAELEDALKQSLEQEMRVQLLQAVEEQYFYGWGWMEDDIAMDAEVSADGGSNSATPQTRTAGKDFSGTNNQEQGVDEADFVKTDG